MKHLLSILAIALCSCSAFGQGAQYRPTPFANGFVQTINSTAAAQTYLGIGSSTNVALLNGTNFFSGTNTFPAAGLFPANNIGTRLLWSSPTNIFVANYVTSAGLSLTNNGDYSATTPLFQFSIPPLLGSNSAIHISISVLKTNANAGAGYAALYVGTNTNFVGYVLFGNTSVGPGGLALTTQAIQLVGSYTIQAQGQSVASPTIPTYTNFADFSVTNTFYIGGMTPSTRTNEFLTVRAYEFYAP